MATKKPVVRRANERGAFDHGWLRTFHTFSFGEYHDPAFMGFRSLRVMNEDWVQPGQGFGMHGHRDMEIVTYVLEGALEHTDSMGNGEVLHPGEVQYMSAGTGIRHSEFNPSASEPVHLYQIWLLPEQRGLTPRYDQRKLDLTRSVNQLMPIASRDGRADSLTIRQDAVLYLSRLDAGKSVRHELAPGRAAWVQIVRGSVQVNGEALAAGDGAIVENSPHVEIDGVAASEILLFDLA